jgi:outer membrane lipoprotein-sorting protein
MTSLVAGSHTLRLWYAGPDHVRVALLGSLGESDLVRNGTDLWTWSSSDKSASHHQVPLTRGDAPHSLASASPVTPQQAADAALKAITPSTKVSTDGTAVVAGRSAYELLLEPRDASSLIGSVRVAIDGKTHVPTRVQVFSRGTGKPGFEVGFTSFDPSAPAASVFRFNPPPGTKVTDSGSRTLTPPAGAPTPGGQARAAAGLRPHVVGTGWTSVAVVKVPTGATSGPASMTRLLQVLPKVSGAWGSGHLLRGTLFSALLTDDGRLAVGAVPPSGLYAALAGR